MVVKQIACTEEWYLPAETISAILSFLPPGMVARCATISKDWRSATHHPKSLKRTRLERAWRTFTHSSDDPETTATRDPVKLTPDIGRMCCVARKGDLVAMGFCNSWYICDVYKKDFAAGFEMAGQHLYSLCFSGEVLIGGDDVGNICGWNIESEVGAFKFKAHSGDVNAIVDLPETLASGGADSLVKIWKKGSWECVKTLEGHRDWVLCLTSARQGKVLISGSIDSTLRLWDVESGSCRKILRGHERGVDCVDVHGETIVSGAMNSTIRIWDMQNGECLQVLWGHTGGVRCVATDGNRVVSGAYDRQVKVWDISEERYLQNIDVGSRVMGVWFDADRLILTTCEGHIWIWNFSEGATACDASTHA